MADRHAAHGSGWDRDPGLDRNISRRDKGYGLLGYHDRHENSGRVVRRPTDGLSCYRARKRLGAWLDGALSAADADWTKRHVAGCERCGAEVAELRRMKTLVAEVAAVPEPDWTGFFPGIVRGIQDERSAPAVAPRRPWWGFSTLWAMGGAAVAAAALAVVLWQGGHMPAPAEASVLVNSAESESPGATVMVYTPPSKDLAVVWVFDND